MWETINQAITWINANQGFVIVILTIVYVLTTIRLWLSAKHSNKLTKEAMMRVSRPFIIVDLYRDKELLYLRVKNTGVIPALDVSAQFDKQVKIYSNNSLNEILKKLTIVGPGVEIKFFLDKIGSFIQRNEDIPVITGGLSYKSPLFDTYEERVVINISLYKELVETS